MQTMAAADPDLDWDEEDEQQANLSARIANWARFTTGRGWLSSTGQCASIEGRYQPERLPEDEEVDRRTPKLTQAELDARAAEAWIVEGAWSELPDLFRFTLQFVYLKREANGFPWNQHKVWRKLRPYLSTWMNLRDYDYVLRLSRLALLNQLKRNGNH